MTFLISKWQLVQANNEKLLPFERLPFAKSGEIKDWRTYLLAFEFSKSGYFAKLEVDPKITQLFEPNKKRQK